MRTTTSRFTKLRRLLTRARTLRAEGMTHRAGTRLRAERLVEAAEVRLQAELEAGRLTEEEYWTEMAECQDAHAFHADCEAAEERAAEAARAAEAVDVGGGDQWFPW